MSRAVLSVRRHARAIWAGVSIALLLFAAVAFVRSLSRGEGWVVVNGPSTHIEVVSALGSVSVDVARRRRDPRWLGNERLSPSDGYQDRTSLPLITVSDREYVAVEPTGRWLFVSSRDVRISWLLVIALAGASAGSAVWPWVWRRTNSRPGFQVIVQ